MVTLDDAREVSKAIVRAIQPISVSVFGSVAQKGIGKDLDLLVIVDDKPSISGEIDLLLYRNLKDYYKKFDIEPFIIPISVFHTYYSKESPFLRLIVRERRSVYMRDAISESMKQARDELHMAEYLYQGKYYKRSCFHSQQSIGRSIKARLMNAGWELERIHSLSRLVTIAEKYKIMVNLSEDEIVFIDRIYRGRYPAETGLLPFGEPSETDAKRALITAKKFL